MTEFCVNYLQKLSHEIEFKRAKHFKVHSRVKHLITVTRLSLQIKTKYIYLQKLSDSLSQLAADQITLERRVNIKQNYLLSNDVIIVKLTTHRINSF